MNVLNKHSFLKGLIDTDCEASSSGSNKYPAIFLAGYFFIRFGKDRGLFLPQKNVIFRLVLNRIIKSYNVLRFSER